MNDVKILDQMQPFNDIYYKDCFFSALFPILKYFGKTHLPYITNNLYLYDYNAEIKTLNINEIIYQDLDSLMKQSGVICTERNVETNIIEEVISSISEGKPVIVVTNDFFNPLRTDAYLKTYAPHNILIYGYDQPNRLVHIIESRYRNTVFYEKLFLSYADIEVCINNSYNSKRYLQYSANTVNSKYEEVNADIKTDYLGFMYHNRKKLLQSIEKLMLFKDSIKGITESDEFIEKTADTWLDSFNVICNRKATEKYINEKVLQIEECQKYISEIYTCWFTVRSGTTKTKLMGKVSQKYKITIEDKLSRIVELESRYIEALLQRS